MSQKPMTRFALTLWLMLGLAWLASGSRFIDWAFGMPDMGPLDDALIVLLVAADDLRAGLGLGDMFGTLRQALHHMTGLG
jgi:hypothetical protein